MEAILTELDVLFLADFLKAKRITHPLVLMSLCKTEEEVVNCLANPFSEGVTIGTVEFKSTEPADITGALFKAIWKRCSENPPPTAAPIASTANVAAAAETKNKVPRKLPAGIWQQQIQKYNEILLGGANRSFPDQMIYGAEVTLARLWHEESANECFTPISLGEIIVARAFTSTGTANPDAVKLSKIERTMFDIESGSLIKPPAPDLDPSQLWQVFDGLQAMRWAYTWAKPNSEAAIIKWHDFMVKVFRERSGHVEAVKNYYNEASLRMCYLRMNKRSLEDAIDEVTSDAFFLQETINSAASKRAEKFGKASPMKTGLKKKNIKEHRSEKAAEPKGKGKGTKTKVCHFFNTAKGCVKADCAWTHQCSKCSKPGHTKAQCKKP
jgi:hypothetical protein